MLERNQPLFEQSLLCADKAWLQILGEPVDHALPWPSELPQLQHPGTVRGSYKIPHSGEVTHSSMIPELV